MYLVSRFFGQIHIYGLVISLLLSGCSWKAWTVFPSLGIRPEKPGLAYSVEVESRCRYYTSPSTSACLDYYNVVEWGEDLAEAYRSRARINEWALTAAGLMAVAAIGALTGLAAFGAAGSDAAKIIPIAGGFASGATAFMDNKRRAKDYTDAANAIRTALTVADTSIDGTEQKFQNARPTLFKAIADQEVGLETKRIEMLEQDARINELKQQMSKMESTLKDALQKIAPKPPDGSSQPGNGSAPP